MPQAFETTPKWIHLRGPETRQAQEMRSRNWNDGTRLPRRTGPQAICALSRGGPLVAPRRHVDERVDRLLTIIIMCVIITSLLLSISLAILLLLLSLLFIIIIIYYHYHYY